MKHLIILLFALFYSQFGATQSLFNDPFFQNPFFSDPFFSLDRIDRPAEFPGGNHALLDYLQSNLRYPRTAKRKGIVGVVEVQFTVDKDGNISHLVVKKPLGYGCDEEALRLVQHMPKWKPATRYSQNIAATYVLPIAFQPIIIETKANFKGGSKALNDYLAKTVTYPTDAVYEGIEGTVMVAFMVTKSGKITRPSIYRSLFPSLDAEALKVVKKMPTWNPATRNKKKIKQNCVMPIEFKLPKTKRLLM